MSEFDKLRIGLSPDRRVFIFKGAQRAVTCSVKHVGEMLGIEVGKIPMGEVRAIAGVVFENPNRFGGRIEYCPEMFDGDRALINAKASPWAPMCLDCGRAMSRLETPSGWCWHCPPCSAGSEPNVPPFGPLPTDNGELPPPPPSHPHPHDDRPDVTGDGYGEDADGWKGETGG